MKTKRLLSITFFVAATVLTNGSFAQVKIGANPTTITSGANLDVEAGNNTHTVVMQSGAVGINTVAPQAHLDVRGNIKALATTGTQTGDIWNGTSNVNGFEVYTNPGGDVWVGIQRAGSVSPLHISKPANATVGEMINFSVGGNGVGTITHTTTSVQYNTTSDQRLKENIHATKFGLEALKTVKVYDYNFKADSKKKLSTGVLAQELHKVYPQAVTVGGADAKANPWQVDYSKLVPMLVKSVQELNEKVESLEKEKAQLSAELTRKATSLSELNDRISRVERILSSTEHANSVSK
ncbi:tail fiber domain-containing protein [Dyadobacter diqingensis]|uniref:tail fiber domain-containing protein n=1 Tax=Dyadobacter diqingensis TaxID=2938121 RepID=UPI0020C3FEF7|nr:tail fiber domain-containing protein [Dyadobacter diqingensis]